MRVRGALLLTLAIVGALWLAYVAAGNLLLHRLVPRLVSKHGDARLAWRHAWTLLPGLVHVRGASFAVQDGTNLWTVELDTLRARVDLLRLARQELLVRDARGSGLAFRLAPRQHDRDAAAQRAFPVIEPPSGVDRAPGGGPDPWSYTVRGLALDGVREIWIGGYRFRGAARLRAGGFHRTPRATELPPATLEDLDGTLHLGGREVAGRVRGALTCALSAFDHHAEEHVERHLSGEARLSGTGGLAFVNYYLRRVPWLRLEGGAGAFDIRLLVRDGRFAPGSRAAAAVPAARASALDFLATGTGSFTWAVTGGRVPESTFRLVLARYAVREAGAARPDLEGDGLSIAGRGTELGLADIAPDRGITIDVPPARVPDVALLNRFLPGTAGLAIVRGAAAARAHFDLPAAGPGGTGALFLEARGVAARWQTLALGGDLALHARLADGDLPRKRFRLDGTALSLRNVALARTGGSRERVDAWWADLRVRHATVTLGRAFALAGTLDVRLRDSAPVLALFTPKKDLPGWIRTLLRVEDVAATARVEAAPGRLAIAPLVVAQDPLELRAKVLFDRRGRHGALYARLGPLALGLALAGDGVHVGSVLHARRWYDAQRGFDLVGPAAAPPAVTPPAPDDGPSGTGAAR